MKPLVLPSISCQADVVQYLSNAIVSQLKGLECPSIALGIQWPLAASAEDIAQWRQTIQFPLAQSIAQSLDARIDFEQPALWLTVSFDAKTVSFQWLPLYVRGHYTKLQRTIAQTRHDCRLCRGKGCSQCQHTGKTTKDSVQELLAGVALPYFGAIALVFHGAGREDVDVRMLGSGRPFIMELAEPRYRSKPLLDLEQSINQAFQGKVQVSKLCFVPPSAVATLKQSQHEKEYEALVSLGSPADVGALYPFLNQPLAIQQRTPKRVSKRRSDALRSHAVTLLSAQRVDKRHVRIRLRTSHGTYVKEWISGDDGRTTPSLASLWGVACACAELDVLAILDGN